MKLRTSLCNPTALKKDITRFAPSWVLYSVGLFLLLSTVVFDEGDYSRTYMVLESMGLMAFINIIYALLNAQLLFGDLFNSRHCNAFHAMPLRRECWYVTHLLAGLLFSIVPNGLYALAVAPLLGTGAMAAGYWMLAVTLQYLFFFGVAVCSGLCVGNRFAMVLVFAIVNFFSLIIWWFVYALYQPLMPSVLINEEIFVRFCPAYQIMWSSADLVNVVSDLDLAYYLRDVESLTMGEGWLYLTICAAIGVAGLVVSLFLYRRRKLEMAGDFMAVKALEPVFLVLYTLSMAAFFQIFAELFSGFQYLFLALGLAVGFFTGRMLLMRTTRVFQPKGFLWFLILVVVFVATMVLTYLDVFGIVAYIPQQEDVKQVKISTHYNPQYGDEPFLTTEEDIAKVLQVHQMVLDGQELVDDDTTEDIYGTTMAIQYQLENGREVIRRYTVDWESPVGQLFKEFLGRPDFVLGTNDAAAFTKNLREMYIRYDPLDYQGYIVFEQENSRELVQGLVEAILADCYAGNIILNGYYDPDEVTIGWIDFNWYADDGQYGEIYHGRDVIIYSSCTNTMNYLEEHSLSMIQDEY